jgi:hypothetical protein
MRVSISLNKEKDKKTWIVITRGITYRKIVYECDEVCVDGFTLDESHKAMELDHVTEIRPKEIENVSYDYSSDTYTYKAKIVHVHTLPYLLFANLANVFSENPLRVRVKVVE